MSNPVTRMRPMPPGELLREASPVPPGLSVNALAMTLGVPATRIHQNLRAKRGGTADTAEPLARTLAARPPRGSPCRPTTT